MSDDDIVEMLRECAEDSRKSEGDYYADQYATDASVFDEAADEIERLRAEIHRVPAEPPEVKVMDADINPPAEAMTAMRDLDRKWQEAVEEMTFFGVPVNDLSRERLLMLVGMLAGENRRLQDESQSLRKMYQVARRN